jgi:hypothetical protein
VKRVTSAKDPLGTHPHPLAPVLLSTPPDTNMLRNLWLLALFALVALSSAFNLDGVEEYIHHGVKR